MNEYLLFFLVAIGLNVAMFVPAFVTQTDKLTDISYALTFIFLAIYGFSISSKEPLHLVVAVAIILWGLRLGTFLFIRINAMKKDKRFDGMRESFFKFLRFWLLQGLSVAVILLSALTIWLQKDTDITIWVYIGIGVFISGLLIEATADMQKYSFNKIPENKGKWIASGLWGISRHPNYLGEIMVWVGLFAALIGQLTGWQYLIASLSPLYIISLLIFVSGIPLLEKSADVRWGKDKKYQAYKSKTAVLIPRIW